MDFKCFIIDLDGVVYRGNEIIEGVDKRIRELKKSAKVFFLTNNSTLSRAGYREKLCALGIACEKEDIITSGYASGIYIKQKYKDPKVFVIGEMGLMEELKDQGIKVSLENCNVVLVGLDRGFTYERLAKALKYIQKGADFIATNKDNTLITEKGLLPGAGALVSALRTASGKEPIVIGKPSDIMAEIILQRTGFDASEVLLIGDRLETDILMGKNAGMKTALVLTGYAKREDVTKSEIKPDYVLEKL